MWAIPYQTFRNCRPLLGNALLRTIREGEVTNVDTWQGQDVRDSAWGATYELQNAIICVDVAGTAREAQIVTDCNMPWAEGHFLERVSGKPLNPPPSAMDWPFTQAGHEAVTSDTKFSHTYPERFWPKQIPEGDEDGTMYYRRPRGIRFYYGDLGDVVKLLAKDPQTRQAYLPVFFPEDTGVVHGERVPCTLGYHFMIRENKLNITYFIRSCDFLRHFPDDVYFAMRLAQWVRNELESMWGADFSKATGGHEDDAPIDLGLGDLTMHMCSLHVFEGDRALMEHRYGA